MMDRRADSTEAVVVHFKIIYAHQPKKTTHINNFLPVHAFDDWAQQIPRGILQARCIRVKTTAGA